MALEPLRRAALASAPSQFRPLLCPSRCSSHTSRVSHQLLLVPSPCPPISSPWSALHKHVLGGRTNASSLGSNAFPPTQVRETPHSAVSTTCSPRGTDTELFASFLCTCRAVSLVQSWVLCLPGHSESGNGSEEHNHFQQERVQGP